MIPAFSQENDRPPVPGNRAGIKTMTVPGQLPCLSSLNLRYKNIGSYTRIYVLLTDTRNRCLHGVILHISCDCHSRCGLPPHQQMARQARQGQQIAWWMLCHYKKKRRIPRLYATTVGGFILCLHGILHISLPTGVIAYANMSS